MNGLEDKSAAYAQEYPFIRDDVFLIARIEPATSRMRLIFKKINRDTGETVFTDELECIHTVITRISPEQYEEIMNDGDAKSEFLKHPQKFESQNSVNSQHIAKSSSESESSPLSQPSEIKISNENQTNFIADGDNDEDIDLDLDEKRFAFKSWVQGISEAGIDALLFQSDLDKILENGIPIAQFLFRNMIRVDISFFMQYLDKIERECKFEGVYHKPSIRANFTIILDVLSDMLTLNSNDKLKLHYYNNQKSEMDKSREINQIVQVLVRIAEIDAEFLFQYNNEENPNIEYEFRYILAHIEELVDFPEYLKLLNSKEDFVRQAVAKNPQAVKLPEYKAFFKDKSPHIRCAVASNLEATKLREYIEFFRDQDSEVRWTAASNQNSIKLPEYVILFTDYDEDIREFARNKEEIFLLPEFPTYFSHKDFLVREGVASHPKSAQYPLFRQLFSDIFDLVRNAVARNPEAIKFPEYALFLTDRYSETKRIATNKIRIKNKKEMNNY